MGLLERITRIFASPDERTRRAVLGVPAATIAGARDGQLVRITGRVVADVAVTAPFSGASVVWYRARYEVLHRNDDQNALLAAVGPLRRNYKPAEWVTNVHAGEACAFFVDDGSGIVALVDGANATILAREHRLLDTRFLDAEPETFQRFMHAHGQPTTAYMGAEAEKRFHEQCVRVGDEIVVAGVAHRTAGAPDHSAYRSTSTVYVAIEAPVALAE